MSDDRERPCPLDPCHRREEPLSRHGGFHLGPRSGRADIRATLRLATSQKVVAIAALSSGGYVMADADIVVTLSACIDGG
ncbi:MAG: hypothetical protein J0J10_22180 [Bosea sp.]|nr:hypothetical protein [Bosea sp. (in: a-proteobacteria)]